MAECPALSTENGKLVLSTNQTTDGTFVVIGCTGFGRQKTVPYNVLCSNGEWNPTPTADCESGFDEREVLILAVSVGCAFLALVVICFICCSGFCVEDPKLYEMGKSEHSGDNLTVVETEDIIHGPYPRHSYTNKRETILSDDSDYRSDRLYRRPSRYSRDKHDGRSYHMYPEKAEVFITDYSLFESPPLPTVIETPVELVEVTPYRRYSDTFDRTTLMEFSRSRRYSDGSVADVIRKAPDVRGAPTDTDNLESVSVVKYAPTNVEPIIQPIVKYIEDPSAVKYVDRPIEVVKPFNYRTKITVGSKSEEKIVKYKTPGTSLGSITHLDQLLENSSDMREVPYKDSVDGSLNLDPTSYFHGRQDFQSET